MDMYQAERLYIRERELTKTGEDHPDYVLLTKDGITYAVFANETEAYEFDLTFPQLFRHCPLTCVNGHWNAFELGRLH